MVIRDGQEEGPEGHDVNAEHLRCIDDLAQGLHEGPTNAAAS